MGNGTLDRTAEFHEAFGIHTPKSPVMPPSTPTIRWYLRKAALQIKAISKTLQKCCEVEEKSTLAMRGHLMAEELAEVFEAMGDSDLVGTLHEIQDLRVVTDGTMLEFGMKDVAHEAFERVHAANMSKLGNDGKPVKNSAGRVIKSCNFIKADLRDLVK